MAKNFATESVKRWLISGAEKMSMQLAWCPLNLWLEFALPVSLPPCILKFEYSGIK